MLAILWARDSWGFLLFFILLQLTFYLIGVRRAKKFAEPIPSILTPGKVSHASSAQSSKAETRREKPRCPPEYEYIFTLPRPRRLRARKIVFLGWLFLIVFFLVFGSLVIRDAHSWLSPGWLSKMNKSPLIIVGIFCLLVFDLFSLLFMQKPRIRELLTDGEAGLGWITNVEETSGKQKHVNIEYEFFDATGRIRCGRCKDVTRDSVEGEVIPVFYVPSTPTSNIALCGANWEILGLDGKVPKRDKLKDRDGSLRLSL